MKQIDRSNYEIWLIDWLDGNLDENQISQLQLFLEVNPDIKEEFDELGTISLNASRKTFQNKNHLKKTTADLTELQFEYLCAAWLENDLSPEQESDLMDAVARDSSRRKTFELIQKTKLIPVSTSYEGKKLLFRRTILRKITAITLIGLTAAAIIGIAVITYVSLPHELPSKNEKISQSVVSGNNEKSDAEKNAAENSSEGKILPPANQRKNQIANSQKSPAGYHLQSNLNEKNDSSVYIAVHSVVPVNRISFNGKIDLTEKIPYSLVAFNGTMVSPEYDDGRSRIGKFIAKVVREKILKEKSVKDSPLKVYEIAKASVTELNKLLGWEMALDERKDANGEINSVYFSSKILKFNAPVKKSESFR